MSNTNVETKDDHNQQNQEESKLVDVNAPRPLFPKNINTWYSILFKKNLNVEATARANLKEESQTKKQEKGSNYETKHYHLKKNSNSENALKKTKKTEKKERELETFISLNIEEKDCVFPHEDIGEHIKAFWKLPTVVNKKIERTCGMIILNKKIMFGFCSKKLKQSYMAHAETDLMSALVKAVRTNTLDIKELHNIDVYSTLQPCAMCSIAIYKAVNLLKKKKGKNIQCNVYFTQKDKKMRCIKNDDSGPVNLLLPSKNFTKLTTNKNEKKCIQFHRILPESLDCAKWDNWLKKNLEEQTSKPIYTSEDMRLDKVCDEAILWTYSTKSYHWHDTVQQVFRPGIPIGKPKKKTFSMSNEDIMSKSNNAKVLRSHSGVVEDHEEVEQNDNKEETKDDDDDDDANSVQFYFVPKSSSQRIENLSPTTTEMTTIQTMWSNVVTDVLNIVIANGLDSDLNKQCKISQFFLFLPQLHKRSGVPKTFNYDPKKAARTPLRGNQMKPIKKQGGYYKTRRRRKKVFSKKVRTTRKRTKLLRKKFTKKKTKRRKKRRKTRRKRKKFYYV